MLVLLAFVLLVTFAFLNRGAAVEPRLDVLFATVERPNLLAVLLLTSIVSAAGALMARAALHELRYRRDVHDRRVAQPVQPPPLVAKVPAMARIATAP